MLSNIRDRFSHLGATESKLSGASVRRVSSDGMRRDFAKSPSLAPCRKVKEFLFVLPRLATNLYSILWREIFHLKKCEIENTRNGDFLCT